MRLSSMVIISALMLGACKKKAPPPAPEVVQIPPEVQTTDEGDNDGSADAPEPAAEPEPAPAPAPAESPEAGARKRLNGLIKDLETSDVAKLRTALEALQKLSSDFPDDATILLNVGVAQHKLGDLSAAKASYDKALAKDPTLGHGYLYLGAMKEEAGDLKAAEALYRKGILKDPDNVDIRVGLVSTLRKQNRTEEVIAEAQKALKVNALSTEIYNDVGLAYLEQKQYLLAKFMFLKALALPGGEEKAYLHANIGRVRYLEGNIPAATVSLKRAVELDPEYVPGLVYLARVYMEDRNYVDTVDLLERASRLDPDNHGVQMNLGIAYRGVKRNEDAKRAYERALELEPSNPDPYLNLGILYGDYYSPKDYTKAVESFNAYKTGGGADAALADSYIEAVEREKVQVERRLKREAEAKDREAMRRERERLAQEQADREAKEEAERLKQEEKEKKDAEEAARLEAERLAAEKDAPAPDAPAPDAPAPAAPAPEAPAPAPEAPAPEAPAPEAPAPEPASPDGGGENPWGE